MLLYVHHTTGTKARHNIHLGQHVGHFLLDELVGSQWPSKLLAIQCVLTSSFQAELSYTQGAPSNAIPSISETAERTLHREGRGEQTKCVFVSECVCVCL